MDAQAAASWAKEKKRLKAKQQGHRQDGMNCPRCKAQNKPQARTCDTCGLKLPLEDEPEQDAQEHESIWEKDVSKLAWWLGFIFLGLPMAILVLQRRIGSSQSVA